MALLHNFLTLFKIDRLNAFCNRSIFSVYPAQTKSNVKS